MLGCATSGPRSFSDAELRLTAAERLRVAPEATVVPHAVPAAEIERARGWIGQGTPKERLERLVGAFMNPRQLGLEYRGVVTASATELLALGHGNCLTLTSLLIGLARGLGFEAYYIDASERRTELSKAYSFSIAEGHIAAVVRVEHGFAAVDFDGELGQYSRYRVIDDLEALAHFHNNRAYEGMYFAQDEGRPIPWASVRDDFERATRLAPALAPAWNNLGVAEANLGHADRAERAYREAIARNAGFGSPYNNLGKLYLDAGDLPRAIQVFTRATQLDRVNPQFHFNRGFALYRAGAIQDAIRALETSMRFGGGSETQQLLDDLRRVERSRRGARAEARP